MRFTFTGPEEGMTVPQLESCEQLLVARPWTEHGNGLCVGADSEMFWLVMNLRPDISRVGFPCTVTPKQNLRARAQCHRVMPVKPPLERNTDMVTWVAALAGLRGPLVATPRTFEEELRSGTWATIRRAKKALLTIIYIWPDGRVEEVTS
jgi:hypothetical protein